MLALLTIGFEAYVNPEGLGGLGGFLFDELIKSEIIHHPCEPLHASSVVWNMDINGFTSLVLRVRYSTYGFVQGRTAEA